ncbi:MAG: phospho-sugar mutase [Chitinispirillaceae bacterium]|nr:phospho-sugar mutase [Chitinispirillaceae bacterium]
MNPEEIINKAREYIINEENDSFRSQVEGLIERNDIHELNDRFYTDLEFGTGGLRGVIGGGYNRMNPFVLRRTTQGLADYINKTVGRGNGSVVIAYDSRKCSDIFALEAALVLCGNHIRTSLFTGLRPTPELSFAVRHLKATAGIVITASHNPPEYNGYKVYWSDGAQIVAPQDNEIIAAVRSVAGKPSAMERDAAISRGLLRMIDREVDDEFIAMVKGCSIRPELLKKRGGELTVVFTPLHGSGAMPVERSLRELGVDVMAVPQQKDPDGAFPTVEKPNPEEPAAMRLALELAEKKGADLAMGTDPDADRLGIAAQDGKAFRLVTGNQLGALLADYILSSRAVLGTMPRKPVLIKTIVTSELQRLIAASYGVACIDTLTGFKYIGEKIREFESRADGPSYIFGGEESYGYLVNTQVRDKDAVSAATMTVEMALFHRLEGRTLFDQLAVLWQRHGYFQETQINQYFKGQSGLRTMQSLMERLRTAPPASIADTRVVTIKDFLDGTTRNLLEGTVKKDISLPSSNVIQFILDDESIITARPSGTEPKIKCYASCRSRPNTPLEHARREVGTRIDTISDALNQLMAGV